MIRRSKLAGRSGRPLVLALSPPHLILDPEGIAKSDHDRGPTKAIAKLFVQVPSYEPDKKRFWFDRRPIFYRGRLDGSARVLCVASDPGPTERFAGGTLVGDAG